MYRVIKAFVDLQDSNFAYSVGDEFPRKGLNVLPSRLKELSGSKNRQGQPLIKEVDEPKAEEPKKERKKSVEKADEE